MSRFVIGLSSGDADASSDSISSSETILTSLAAQVESGSAMSGTWPGARDESKASEERSFEMSRTILSSVHEDTADTTCGVP